MGYKLPSVKHTVFANGIMLSNNHKRIERIPKYDRYYGNYINYDGNLYQVTYRNGYTVNLGKRIDLNKKPALFKRKK